MAKNSPFITLTAKKPLQKAFPFGPLFRATSLWECLVRLFEAKKNTYSKQFMYFFLNDFARLVFKKSTKIQKSYINIFQRFLRLAHGFLVVPRCEDLIYWVIPLLALNFRNCHGKWILESLVLKHFKFYSFNINVMSKHESIKDVA